MKFTSLLFLSALQLITSTNLKKEEYHYLVQRLTGIYKQDITEFEKTPGIHWFIQMLEFDQDLAYYKLNNMKCNDQVCPKIKIAPISDRYDMRKIVDPKPGQKGFTLIFNMANGKENFTAKFKNEGKELILEQVVEKKNVISKLIKQDSECDFDDKEKDICITKLPGTVCSFEHRCRIPGRFLTPCTTDSDCNPFYKYYCDKEDKVCRIPGRQKYKAQN